MNGKSLENVQIVPVSPERLKLVLLENKEVSITKSGIKIKYIVYDNEDLLSYQVLHGFSKVLVKYDRNDLGSILVFDKFKDKYFSVSAINEEYQRIIALSA